MIRLSKLSKTYTTPTGETVWALRDIELTVEPGEIFGIIGRSGAGKSTLIRCINLLEQPTSGSIFIDGDDITELRGSRLRQVRHQIGMIFQHFNLLSVRNVLGNVLLPLELMKMSPQERRDRALPLLELTGLADKQRCYPGQLSGGQKQRIAIARALASHPKVLLCDEATSALDPETTMSILELLKDINRKLGLTVVLITHDMDVLKSICDRVAVLDHGVIVEQTDIVNFFIHPQTTVGKTFVNSCLKMELPPAIEARLSHQQIPDSYPLLRISFRGDVASEPLMSQLVEKFSLKINILQANIENIHEVMIGILVVEVMGDLNQLEQGIAFLKSKGVQVEVLGYVK